MLDDRRVPGARGEIVEELKETHRTVVHGRGHVHHLGQLIWRVGRGWLHSEVLEGEHERIERHAHVDPIVAEAEEGGEAFEIADEHVGVQEELPVEQMIARSNRRRTRHDVSFGRLGDHSQ